MIKFKFEGILFLLKCYPSLLPEMFLSFSVCLEQCGFFKRAVYYRIMPKYHGVKVCKEERYKCNLAFQPEQELSKKLWVTNWTEMHEYYYWPLHLSPSRARGVWWLEDDCLLLTVDNSTDTGHRRSKPSFTRSELLRTCFDMLVGLCAISCFIDH